MFTIENAQLVLKDKNGNVARIQNLGPNDIAKIHNAIADIGKLVDPVSHLPIKATANTVGVVQLADDEAIAAGTTGRVVDAKQLQDAVMGVSPANCVTNVAAGSTANKIKVTKDGYTTTIVIDHVEHASFANQATHATLADTADISARATKADDATHAAKADEATHAVNADEAAHATKADTATSANSVAWANVSGKPSTFAPSSHTHDDRYYTEGEIDTKLNSKANTSGTYPSLNVGRATVADNGVDSYGTGWIRFKNGIQICWHHLDTTNHSTIGFAKPFTSEPSATVSHETMTNEPVIATISTLTATTIGVRLTFPSGNTTVGNAQFIAIGTWK